MTKQKIKSRGNGTLNLTIGKRYRPMSRNIFDIGGGPSIPQVNNSITGFGSIKTMNPAQASAAGFTPAKTGLDIQTGATGKTGTTGGGGATGGVGDIMGKASSALGGLSGLVQGFTSSSQIADTSGIRAGIEDTAGTDFASASDFQSLSDTYSDMNWQDSDYGMWDVRGASKGQLAGNVLSSAASGAMTGLSVGGPWGALIGGVVGLGTGLAGVFTGNAKAKREAEELNRLAQDANQRAQNNFFMAQDSLKDDYGRNLLENVAAEGGRIHIKPSKKGTFTAAAKRHGKSVQAFASQVLANKDNYSPAMVKKANFARSASKWKHSLGGFLYGEGGNLHSNVPDSQTHGTDFSNGMTFINKGGTHEQNPLEGVQMGVDPQGIPNLVEEGEVIFNDYVFSNRLHPSEKELGKANLPKRYKGHTFALIAEDMGKESSERPNDPISRRGLEDSMMKLAMVQEAQRARKGKKGTQQLMAYGGRRYAGDENIPDTPKIPDINLPLEIEIEDTPVEVPDTEISVNPYSFFVPKVNKKGQARNRGVWVDSRGNVKGRRSSNPYDADNALFTWGRYAPVVGSAVGALTSLLEKPDYGNSDILLNEADSLSRRGVRFRPLNRYMRYNPLDRNYLLNRVGAQAGATRRAILNASAGNSGAAMAGLLAADRQAQESAGDALIKMDQQNDALRREALEFNRGTDQYNSQGLMQADAQNVQFAQNRDRLRSTLLSQSAQMREAADTALEATRSANLTNLFDNIGGMGQENFIMNQIASNPSLYYQYTAPGKGTVGFKGRNGGMLTKKDRRRK